MPDSLSKTESQASLIKHNAIDSTLAVSEQKERKKSLFQRLQSKKRAKISEEDLFKYTGMTKQGLADWARDRPGVGKNKSFEGAMGPPEAAGIAIGGC